MAELDRAAISFRLAQAREQAGLTQPEMAELLRRDDTPLHWRTVQNYESPKLTVVPWDLIDQWARITGTTKEWLLHGEEATEALDVRQELASLQEAVARIERLLTAEQPPGDSA